MKKPAITLIIFSVLFFIFSESKAQSSADSTIIAQVKWNKQKVEKGIVWKQAHFEDLYQSQQEVNILEVDLRKSNIHIAFAGRANKLKTTSEFVEEENAIGGINGSYFSKNGGSISFFKADNRIINFSRQRIDSKIGDRLNAAVIVQTNKKGRSVVDIIAEDVSDFNWAEKIDAPNVMVCGPLLLMNDTLASLLEIPFNNNRHPRSAIAVDGHKLILITVDGRNKQAHGMNIPELAFFFKANRCRKGP